MKHKIELGKAGEFFKKAYQKIGKRNLIVALAILVIAGAVYVNYRIFSDPIGTIGYGTNNMEDTYGAAAGGESRGREGSGGFLLCRNRTQPTEGAGRGTRRVADRGRQCRGDAGDQSAGVCRHLADRQGH